MDFHTLCVHGNEKKDDFAGAIGVPLFQSAAFVHSGAEQAACYDDSSRRNPTREHLEITVARLENGFDAMAFSSGMAALAAIMELFSPGDHIIASDDLYGASYRLLFYLSVKNGLTFSLIDTSDIRLIEAAVTPNTRAIFVETPTALTMRVTDIAAVSLLARKRGFLTITDNTFMTPYFQKPLDLGADIVLYSGAKYLCGHSDTLAGFLVVKNAELSEQLRLLQKTAGAHLSPFDSWLLIRSIKTLPIRLERHQETATQIARWLTWQPKIKAVNYSGLRTHPQFELSRRQASGFGAMLSFEAESEKLAKRILGRVRVIQHTETLGGVESLITYPVLQAHADIPEAELAVRGINNRLLCLSAGLESSEDLLADLEQAIE